MKPGYSHHRGHGETLKAVFALFLLFVLLHFSLNPSLSLSNPTLRKSTSETSDSDEYE